MQEPNMEANARELVVLMTHGADHELSSVGFTIANGGMTAGLKVSVFLTSAAVDLVRKRANDNLVVHPLEPLNAMIKDFLARGGKLWAWQTLDRRCCALADSASLTASSVASESLGRVRSLSPFRDR
jgi:predicted peroxiredoxin